MHSRVGRLAHLRLGSGQPDEVDDRGLDHDHLLVRRRRAALQASTGASPSANTNYLWDATTSLPEVALERDGNNKLLRRYLYGMQRLSMNSGGFNYFYHYDPLGSVSELTSSTGAPQWTYGYEPFGATRTETKNNTKAPTNLLKFTGEYLDPTGLYHLRARQYDPASGRFLSVDPLTPSLTQAAVSPYAYVANRPTIWIDPLGLRWCWKVCTVYDTVEAGAEVVGEAVVDVVTDPKLALAFGAMGAACAVTGGTGCLAWGLSAVAVTLADSAKRNFFSDCGSAEQFAGDFVLEVATLGAGQAVKPLAGRLVRGRIFTKQQTKRFRRVAPAVVFGAKQVGKNIKETPPSC